jgi:hypothetical protein
MACHPLFSRVLAENRVLCYDAFIASTQGDLLTMRGRCPKCHGNLYFETDIAEGLLLRKCLQCGLIESYFWLERSTRELIPLLPEPDPLPLARE